MSKITPSLSIPTAINFEDKARFNLSLGIFLMCFSLILALLNELVQLEVLTAALVALLSFFGFIMGLILSVIYYNKFSIYSELKAWQEQCNELIDFYSKAIDYDEKVTKYNKKNPNSKFPTFDELSQTMKNIAPSEDDKK